jgi:hypothetical protein
MANISRNILFYRLNDLVHDPFGNYQTVSGKFISVPAMSRYQDGTPVRVKKSPLLRVQRAARYACFAQGQAIYVNKALQYGTSGYSMALMDFLVPPKVLEIDVTAWTGEIGETIRVRARDNVAVAGMLLVIRDAHGSPLEAGQAAPRDLGSAWWLYTTRSKVDLEPFPTVQVIVRDHAGNRGSLTLG